jgi:hypothetical protein
MLFQKSAGAVGTKMMAIAAMNEIKVMMVVHNVVAVKVSRKQCVELV